MWSIKSFREVRDKFFHKVNASIFRLSSQSQRQLKKSALVDISALMSRLPGLRGVPDCPGNSVQPHPKHQVQRPDQGSREGQQQMYRLKGDNWMLRSSLAISDQTLQFAFVFVTCVFVIVVRYISSLKAFSLLCPILQKIATSF